MVGCAAHFLSPSPYVPCPGHPSTPAAEPKLVPSAVLTSQTTEPNLTAACRDGHNRPLWPVSAAIGLQKCGRAHSRGSQSQCPLQVVFVPCLGGGAGSPPRFSHDSHLLCISQFNRQLPSPPPFRACSRHQGCMSEPQNNILPSTI